MEKTLHDFIECIAKENQILDSLAELGQEKRQLIILGKVKELDNLIQKEGIAISNLDKVEGARFKLQSKLASELGIDSKDLKAENLLPRIKESFPELIEELEEKIKRLDYEIVRLKAINTHNNELINQSLDYIGEMQSMLSGDVAGTYSDKGLQTDESESRPKLNLLDKKI